MSDPETIIRRYVAAWGSGDLSEFEELLAPDFEDVMYGQPRTREQLLREAADQTYERRTEVDDVLVAGDRVVARMRSHLVHRETGGQAVATGMIWLRVVGGKIVEGWGEHDRLGVLQQLGALPSGPELRGWLRERLGLASKVDKDVFRAG